MVPKLVALRQRLPGVEIELVGEAREVNLTRREADIALRMRQPEAPGLVARLLTDIDYGLFATCEYLQRVAEPDWDFVAYDESLATAPQHQWLLTLIGSRRLVFRTNDLGILADAVRAGLGVGALPRFMAAHEPGVQEILAPRCPVKRPLWLVMHPDVRRSPRVRAVADEIIRMFAPEV